ncbi:MAG: diguanylate cyclase domain-containing protein, partial [Vulcanococcus sp.]
LAQVRSTDMQISSDAPVMVTLSIGVAASDGPSRYQLAQLMTAADAALYMAKDRGRAQVANLELEAQRTRSGGRIRNRIDGWQVRGA